MAEKLLNDQRFPEPEWLRRMARIHRIPGRWAYRSPLPPPSPPCVHVMDPEFGEKCPDCGAVFTSLKEQL